MHFVERSRTGGNAHAQFQRHGENQIVVKFFADGGRVIRRYRKEESARVRQHAQTASFGLVDENIGAAFDHLIQRVAFGFVCGKSFRVYSNPDFIGVQLGGAVKNVIAIGAGMSDGIGFGANARTALITRGLAEMSRLGAALGADPATFMGMAGLGDLVLTCTDNQSRNRRFGMMLGQGMDVQSAQEKIGQVVEGYRNTKEVRELAHRFGVEMPITEEIYQVLYCGKNAREAALTLLGRARKDERSSH